MKHSRKKIRVGAIASLGLVLAVALIMGAVVSASAQGVQPEAKKTPTPFSEMKVAPASLAYKQITFGKTGASESKSFTVEDIGTAPLTVTVTSATRDFSGVRDERTGCGKGGGGTAMDGAIGEARCSIILPSVG